MFVCVPYSLPLLVLSKFTLLSFQMTQKMISSHLMCHSLDKTFLSKTCVDDGDQEEELRHVCVPENM